MSIEAGKSRFESMGAVEESADLDKAAEGVMKSAYSLGRQKCSACSRVYVHKKVEAPVDSLEEAVGEFNKVNYGLTAGIFSRDERELQYFFNEIETDVLYANRRSGATTGAWPGVQSFCDWKKSGSTGKGGCGPYYV